MSTGWVITGRSFASVITCGPAPGIANVIESRAAVPFAALIALRSDPAPLLLVLLTANVAACAGAAMPSAMSEAPRAPRGLRGSMGRETRGRRRRLEA